MASKLLDTESSSFSSLHLLHSIATIFSLSLSIKVAVIDSSSIPPAMEEQPNNPNRWAVAPKALWL